ncbi:MAG: hypothetical protein ACOYOV_12260 [Bacteroidales bacterium]
MILELHEVYFSPIIWVLFVNQSSPLITPKSKSTFFIKTPSIPCIINS